MRASNPIILVGIFEEQKKERYFCDKTCIQTTIVDDIQATIRPVKLSIHIFPTFENLNVIL